MMGRQRGGEQKEEKEREDMKGRKRREAYAREVCPGL